jgi:hypothetical protein
MVPDWATAYAAVLLAPTKSPACLSHDQTGFQPVAYR